MTGAYGAFGGKSYEYAVGSIRASAHQPISKEKMARIAEADLETAKKLIEECGYPPVGEGKTVYDSIEAEKNRMTAFVRDIAPDEELVSAMLFEEDALNLKLYLKARLLGRDDFKSLPTVSGSIDPDVFEVCVAAEDFSVLGEEAERELEGVFDDTDAARVSGRADRAMFLRALGAVEKKHCRPLESLFLKYADCKNRITALRMRKLGLHDSDCPYAFLPVRIDKAVSLGDFASDENKSETEIITSANDKLSVEMADLGYEAGMGAIAEYFFAKKSEAAKLRYLFAEKSLGGNNDNGGDAR